MPGISAVPDDVNARYFHVVVAGPEVFSRNDIFLSFLYHLVVAGPQVSSYNHTFFVVAGSDVPYAGCPLVYT